MDGLVAAVFVIYGMMFLATVRETDGSLTVSDSDRGNGIDADKRAGVVLLVSPSRDSRNSPSGHFADRGLSNAYTRLLVYIGLPELSDYESYI